MNAASSPLRNSVMTLPASTPPPNAQAEALTPQCDSKRAEDVGDESPGRQAQREGTPAWSLPGPRLTESFWGWRWEWLCNEGSWEEKQAVSWLSLGETGKFAIHRTSARSFHRWQCCVGWDITRPSPSRSMATGALGTTETQGCPSRLPASVGTTKVSLRSSVTQGFPQWRGLSRWGRAGPCRARQPGVMSNAVLYERMSFYTEFKFHIFNLIIQRSRWDHWFLGISYS